MPEWKTNIKERTASHTSGMVVRFAPAEDTPGAWDGKVVAPLPDTVPADASILARLMREAGDAFLLSIKTKETPS